MSGLPQFPLMAINRRAMFSRTAGGLAAAALASLGQPDATGAEHVASGPHFPPRAKRVIYLFQSGGPSHIDLFDHKPQLAGQGWVSCKRGPAQHVFAVSQLSD